MIKIQTANQNQPRVITYPHIIFSPPPAVPLAPVSACCTRAMFAQQLLAACPSVWRFQRVKCVQHFSPPHHLSTQLNTPLKQNHMLKVPFNTTIAHGLIWKSLCKSYYYPNLWCTLMQP